MIKIQIILFFLLLIGVEGRAQETQKQSITNGWFFHKGEVEGAPHSKSNYKTWSRVDLPHTYNPSGSEAVYRDQKQEVRYEGVAWYQKELFIEKDLEGKRLFLHFDGAYIDTDVYLNGEKIGNHKGGFTAFVFEITDKVDFEKENLISVRVSNEYNPDITPLGGGYVKFGGITRPVSLIVKDKFCISPTHFASTGVYCKQLNVNESNAELEVETVLNSVYEKTKYKVVCSLLDSKNETVAKKSSKGTVGKGESHIKIPMVVKNPNLWDGLENPTLYSVRVQLYAGNKLVDEIVEKTGFRTVAVDRDRGFFLNEKSYPLKGVAQHQYYPGVGSAMKKEHFDEDMDLLLDLGANAIRLSHYPHSKYRYELLDKNGVVAFTELAWIKEFFGTEAFKESCYQQMMEMVYQLYNHPSIAIWGLFNEIRYDEFKGINGMPIAEELNRMTKEADPSRLTCGVSWKAGRRNDIADISGWNRYQGWYWNAYHGSPNDFTWIEQIRNQHPKRKLGITEYGGGGATTHFDENRKIAPYNKDQFHPVDFYNYSHEEHWKEISKRPWLWGTFIWTLNEFLVPNYDQGRASFLHDKGLVSENRMDKKDVFYFYKANWKKEPVFHLAYEQFEIRLEANAEVTVYSNLNEVNLSLNGVELGTLKNAPYGIYRWSNVVLTPGDNTIEVQSKQNGRVYSEKANWHFVQDIHNSDRLHEIVSAQSEWKVLFKEEFQESKKRRGTGVPGEEVNASFNINSTIWQTVSTWDTITLPLYTASQTTKGNWPGKMVYLTKEFTLEKNLKNPHLYLKHTAQMSKGNEGRVSVAVDGVGILTLEEGCEDYRLISVIERLGELKSGNHTISIIANTPEAGGILDIGFVDKK